MSLKSFNFTHHLEISGALNLCGRKLSSRINFNMRIHVRDITGLILCQILAKCSTNKSQNNLLHFNSKNLRHLIHIYVYNYSRIIYINV